MTQEDFEKEGGLREMSIYFWNEKGNPERFTGWDAEAMGKFWPEFLVAWEHFKSARRTMNAICAAQQSAEY